MIAGSLRVTDVTTCHYLTFNSTVVFGDMKILVTGICGFTGTHVASALLRQGHHVAGFVRASTDRRVLDGQAAEWHVGDLDQPESLAQALTGVDALVNLASIGFGHAPAIVQAAQAAGVRRAVFFSTTALFTRLNVSSKTVRLAAEKAIEDGGLDYTIIRPTMIYGTPRDRNMCRLIRFVRKWPVVPVVGNGRSLQQPVYVSDLADAVVRVLQTDATIGKAYNLSGARPLTFEMVITTIASLLQKRVSLVHIPVRPFVTGLGLFEKLGLSLPIKAEQIMRLNEDKAFDHQNAVTDFGYAPRTFEDGIALEVADMGLLPR